MTVQYFKQVTDSSIQDDLGFFQIQMIQISFLIKLKEVLAQIISNKILLEFDVALVNVSYFMRITFKKSFLLKVSV
jgi:hypothetical protein